MRYVALCLHGLLAVFAGLLTSLALAKGDLAFTSTAVRTEAGVVLGRVTRDSRQFLGIPYAAPPVDDLRWAAPRPVTPWKTPRDARKFAPNCPQSATAFGVGSENEDCLYLNIFTPAPSFRHRPYPVMIWLHPGAFQYGLGDDFIPNQLLEKDVIVVTLNYRLGALGFLAHPGLTGESSKQASGNYGLLDQQAALRWIRRNIARFGGNPDNVTLFGQSAGGASVSVHLASPLSRGLFHRAIVQSGAYTLTQPTLAEAEAAGVEFATAVGCSDQSLECLRALPVATLLANARPSTLGYLPTVDGHVLNDSVLNAFATGRFNKVPVLTGATQDEYRLFVPLFFDFVSAPVTEQTYAIAISALLGITPEAVPDIVAAYPLTNFESPGVAAAALATDRTFSCRMLEAAQSLAQYVPTWVYEFADEAAPQIYLPSASFDYGAYHGSELPYLFNVRTSVPAPPLTPAQQQLSRTMIQYWTQFAHLGMPNSLRTPWWPRFNDSSPMLLQLDAPQPKRSSATDFANQHRCEFWATFDQ